MLDSLCGWAKSMPWVVVKPSSVGTLFMIQCGPLSCYEPWFALSELGEGFGAGPGLFVVLPDPDSVARRGLGIDWALGLAELGKQRCLTALELPACPQHMLGLQRELLTAYSCAFEAARKGS